MLTAIADSIFLQREHFISSSNGLSRIDCEAQRPCFWITVFYACKVLAHKWAFLLASGNINQNFPSWVPRTAHLNNVCKDHGNGRCLKLSHVYLHVEHGFRHLASYLKNCTASVNSPLPDNHGWAVLTCKKTAKRGCRQQELVQRGCASWETQGFFYCQVSNAASANSGGVE